MHTVLECTQVLFYFSSVYVGSLCSSHTAFVSVLDNTCLRERLTPSLPPSIPHLQVDELSFEEGDTLYIIDKVSVWYFLNVYLFGNYFEISRQFSSVTLSSDVQFCHQRL